MRTPRRRRWRMRWRRIGTPLRRRATQQKLATLHFYGAPFTGSRRRCVLTTNRAAACTVLPSK